MANVGTSIFSRVICVRVSTLHFGREPKDEKAKGNKRCGLNLMLRNTGVLICFLSFLPVASTAECFQWSYFNLDKTDATFKSGEQWKDKFIDYTIFSHMKRDDGWVMLPQQTTPFEFNNRQYEIVGGDFLDLTVRPQCPLRKFIPELECRLPWGELLNYNQRSKREEEELQRPKRAVAAAFLASSSASDSANARRQEEEKKKKKRIDFLRLIRLADWSTPLQVKWRCSRTENCCGTGCCRVSAGFINDHPIAFGIINGLVIVLIIFCIFRRCASRNGSRHTNRNSKANPVTRPSTSRESQSKPSTLNVNSAYNRVTYLPHELYIPPFKKTATLRSSVTQTDVTHMRSNDAQCQTILSQSSLLPTYDELPRRSELPRIPSSDEFPPPYSRSSSTDSFATPTTTPSS
ncbi:hypothetical protein M3Y98_01224800 [Aphelenchoides besseyi]|nr:hypothetical protein M3Y98_01224800 [Aphelenchoides besseyi]